jgi:hypothetical protein
MSDDRIRAAFRKADASLGYAPPDLDRTIRKARRGDVRIRIFATLGVAAVIAAGVLLGGIALRPDPQTVIPIASGTPAPTPVPTPCGDLSVIGDNPNAFVDDFMKRRISGAGAESCLTTGALEQYRTQNADPYDPNANGGAGPLCLYACGDFRVVEYRLETSSDAADANSYQAAVIVMLSDGKETVRQYEAFAFGPGVPSTSNESQVFVVRGAWATPGLP